MLHRHGILNPLTHNVDVVHEVEAITRSYIQLLHDGI
jgi:hypothetical protein